MLYSDQKMSREFDFTSGEMPGAINLEWNLKENLPGVEFYMRNGRVLRLNKNRKPGEVQSEDDYIFSKIVNRAFPIGALGGGSYKHPASISKYSTYEAPDELSAELWEKNLTEYGYTKD